MNQPLFARLIALVLAGSIAALPLAVSAAAGKMLSRVSGSVGYKSSDTSDLVPLAGDITLSDNAIAITQARSTAKVLLEDSSTIGLGQSTSVRLGAFNSGIVGPGSVITINGGAMRFNIVHPAGARANYRFVTPTAQIAVRGTSGLIASGPNGDDIACVQCEPGDVVVTVGTATYSLVSGQAIHITPGGVATTAQIQPSLSNYFVEQGLSMEPQTAMIFSGTFAPNVAALAVPASTASIGALAVFLGGIIAIFVSGQHTTTTQPTSPGVTITITSHIHRPAAPHR